MSLSSHKTYTNEVFLHNTYSQNIHDLKVLTDSQIHFQPISPHDLDTLEAILDKLTPHHNFLLAESFFQKYSTCS
jgi:hypothetical protein